jgi:hypothetical protein
MTGKSAKTEFWMECACGATHTFDETVSRVECPCGANYVTTITELTPPGTAVPEQR